MDLPLSEKRQAEAKQASEKELPLVAKWLLIGERGASSNAMCQRFFGVPQGVSTDHPCEPDDLRRCVIFLEATDSHDLVPLMSDVSEEWARLVARWHDLMIVVWEEMEAGRNASRTYALMKEILQ